MELQKLATFMGVDITVCHFPPGTSKWNKIEHRLFSFITQNWRGKPLYDLLTVVNLISNTTTSKGLTVRSAVDTNIYPKGIEVSDADPEARKLIPTVPDVLCDNNVSLLMDKAYEGDEVRSVAVSKGLEPFVPPKSNRKEPWEYDKKLYKRRNEVEAILDA